MTATLYAVHMAREDPPRYRQIADDLRARMESGEFPPDSRLPSISKMERHYGVALNTINRAIGVLREAGLAETVHGVGTFARKPAEAEPSAEYRELTAQIRLLGERMDAAEAWIAEQEQRDRLAPTRAARSAPAGPPTRGSSRLAAGTLAAT